MYNLDRVIIMWKGVYNSYICYTTLIMKLETRKKQIEILFYAIPIFLFFVYPFVWGEEYVFIYYYLAVFLVTLLFSFKGIKMIVIQEKIDLSKLVKSYNIFFILYTFILQITIITNYIQFLIYEADV